MPVIRRCAGFTLVELSIVVLVLALLLGSLLVPLATQVEQRKVAEAQKLLEDAREAIIGYAMVTGRLPRPADAASNGAEIASCGGSVITCTGFVPWATLGLQRFDPWGKQLRYSVSPNFADASFTFATSTANNKTVQTRDSAGTLVTLVAGVPAVIVTQGSNNWGFGEAGEFADLSTTNADEDANDSKFKCTVAANCNNFISRTKSASTSAPGGEFDDMVEWIPNALLFNRMVAAGRLP